MRLKIHIYASLSLEMTARMSAKEVQDSNTSREGHCLYKSECQEKAPLRRVLLSNTTRALLGRAFAKRLHNYEEALERNTLLC